MSKNVMQPNIGVGHSIYYNLSMFRLEMHAPLSIDSFFQFFFLVLVSLIWFQFIFTLNLNAIRFRFFPKTFETMM